MKVDIVDISPVRKKVTIEVDAEKVTSAIKAAFEEMGKDAEVEGFRKGKVPEDVIRQRFGTKVLEQVASDIVQDTFHEALEQHDITPTSKAEVDVTKLTEGKPMLYSVFIDVAPNIDVEGYKDIKLEAEPFEVKDEEVKEALDRITESRGEFSEVDRAAGGSDMVTVDFECHIDGELIPSGSAKAYAFSMDGGARFPEFEDAAKGLKAGESGSFKKSFPEAYHDKAVAGKEADFTVKVCIVKEKKPPALDDEFAREMGCDSLDDLKKKVKEEIQKGKERNERDRQKTAAMDKLIEANPFDIPESLITRYYNQITGSIMEGVRRGVANPREVNLSSDEFKSRYFEMATNQAKGDLILDSIASKENISITDKEIDFAIEGLAASRGESPQKIREMIDKEGVLEHMKDGIRKEKVFDIILGKYTGA